MRHLLQAVAGTLGELARSTEPARVLIGHKPFEGADGDGLVDGSAAAGRLARSTANPSANGGERIGPAGDQVRGLVISGSDGADIAAGVSVHRAGELALD